MLMLLSGCFGRDRVSSDAICSGTQVPRDNHVNSLITYGEQIISVGAGQVLVTGQVLVSSLDAACEQ